MKRWAVLLVAMGCRTPAPVEPPRLEVWVDGSALDDGDGSNERPFKAFRAPARAQVRVATGLYEFSGLLEDVEVLGGKAVVLHGEGLQARRATLRGLMVQGGEVGLLAREAVTLDDVSFSGQRKVAVRVEGDLTMTGGTVEGSVPETRGVHVLGRAAVSKVTFTGALRRAVFVEGGEATLEDVRSEGPAEALHVEGGKATARRVRAVGGRGPAFFVSPGHVDLYEIEVVGHEQAVLTGNHAELHVAGLKSDRASAGAVSLVLSDAVLSHLVVTRPGPHGAVESLEGKTTVEDLTVTDATDYAVVVRHGRLVATGVRITTVRGDGDGIMVRDATASLTDVTVTDALGAGVVASAVATVEVNGLRCSGCQHGALVVERRSTVKARDVFSEGSREAAVSLPDDGSLELDGLEGGGVWAACEAGSRVVLKGKLPARELLSGRCIELPPPPRPDSGK